MNALISVTDKSGIVEFARALHAMGVRLISTGGTAKLLAEKAGLPRVCPWPRWPTSPHFPRCSTAV